MPDFAYAPTQPVGAFDFSDVDADAYRAEWLERQTRRAMDQRRRAFQMGYRTACEDTHRPLPEE